MSIDCSSVRLLRERLRKRLLWARKLIARRKITLCLWFDGKAEEATRFCVSIFPDSGVTSITPGLTGAALVVKFWLAGLEFLALNGGPEFMFNEAITLSIDCQSQAEFDELWERLSASGSTGRCGWLKDRYGVSFLASGARHAAETAH